MRIIDVIIAVFLCIALSGCLRMMWLLKRYRFQPLVTKLDETSKPTVSVCVPARNERHTLAQCLENIIASDYQKLEILVLDDSSDDETSVIIRSFAHEGVRFIAGEALPVGWIGKNHAYYTLAQAANGEILLFLDVDTLINSNTISQLVSEFESKSLKMFSVLPRREDAGRTSALFGTMRYLWELLVSSERHAVAASAIWLVSRQEFIELVQGSPVYRASIRPETVAANLFSKNNGYQYVIGTRSLGVRYEKRWRSQAETAIRLYYPLAGANPFGWLLMSIILIGLAFIGLTPGWIIGGPLASVGDACFLIICASFAIYNFKTMGGSWLNIILRSVIWPILILQGLTLLTISFIRYQTNTITWKNRRLFEQPVNHSYHRIDE